MTGQQQMRQLLQDSGLPAKEIKVYGSQIVITCWSRKATQDWAALISKFAKIRGFVESFDEAKMNTNTVLRPSVVRVWRVFAVI